MESTCPKSMAISYYFLIIFFLDRACSCKKPLRKQLALGMQHIPWELLTWKCCHNTSAGNGQLGFLIYQRQEKQRLKEMCRTAKTKWSWSSLRSWKVWRSGRQQGWRSTQTTAMELKQQQERIAESWVAGERQGGYALMHIKAYTSRLTKTLRIFK